MSLSLWYNLRPKWPRLGQGRGKPDYGPTQHVLKCLRKSDAEAKEAVAVAADVVAAAAVADLVLLHDDPLSRFYSRLFLLSAFAFQAKPRGKKNGYSVGHGLAISLSLSLPSFPLLSLSVVPIVLCRFVLHVKQFLLWTLAISCDTLSLSQTWHHMTVLILTVFGLATTKAIKSPRLLIPLRKERSSRDDTVRI